MIPAPMMATFGLRRGLLLSGGAGDKILSVKYWKTWNQNRKGWNKGLSTLDSEGILRSSGVSNSKLKLGNKGAVGLELVTVHEAFIPLAAYTLELQPMPSISHHH